MTFHHAFSHAKVCIFCMELENSRYCWGKVEGSTAGTDFKNMPQGMCYSFIRRPMSVTLLGFKDVDHKLLDKAASPFVFLFLLVAWERANSNSDWECRSTGIN